MEKIFGKNWRTTVAGIAGGILTTIADLYVSGGVLTAKTIVSAIIPVIIGKLAKDAGVSGEEK